MKHFYKHNIHAYLVIDWFHKEGKKSDKKLVVNIEISESKKN